MIKVNRISDYIKKLRYAFRKMRYRSNLNKECIYWEKMQELVNESGNDYYVIRRKGKVGLFSIYITTVGQIKYAFERGLIPIIDLKNYRNEYMGIESIGKYNPWEVLFEQPSGEMLEDVEKEAGTLYYCEKDVPDERPNDETDFLYTLNDVTNEWRSLVSKYIRVNSQLLEHARSEFKVINNNGQYRVLGVLCRGTDYIKLCPKNHPIQPDMEEVFDKVDSVMMEYKCQRIFLATEDVSYEAAFKTRFKEVLFVIQENKMRYNGSGYLDNTIRLLTQNERMQTGVNYLKKVLILSMCQCFVAGRTSGTVGVMLQYHNFDYTFFFDKGRY